MVRAVAERTSSNDTLVGFLQEKAREFGPRTALLIKPGFRYRRWTYSQLWDAAGGVATLLQQRGLTKGDRALIWAHNSPEWVIAFFGCMRAGVIIVPLDLRSSSDFVHRVVSKTGPKIAFVSRMTPQTAQDLGVSQAHLEELEALTGKLPSPEIVRVAADDLAEIMFTSGTTGDPKGVMLSHGNLTSNIYAAGLYDLGKTSDRLLSILPLSHMFEQMGGLLLALRVGANVTYPTSRQPTVLFKTMSERRVTLMLLVPQALDLMMKGIEREVSRQGKEKMWRLSLKVARFFPFRLRRLIFRRVHQRFGGAFKLVFCGGAALDSELGAKWELLGVNIIQGYGATEASPLISCHKATRPRYDSAGLPLPGVEVKISEQGEVLLRGPNITSGYWKDPDKTAEAFEDGWYKTGDQGFLDKDGFLHLNGRKKDMIVLQSGQNVFPEDIETVLKRHEHVTDSAVVGLPRGPSIEVHAALIVSDPGVAAEVVSWANGQLAEHQQIRGFTTWPEEDFPRTHILKVKKGIVIEMLQGAAAASPAAVRATDKPQDAGAPSLVAMIAEIPELVQVEVTPEKDLGNDLNLDSLKRVELLSAIEGEWGVYLDENVVGADTTVRSLQELVERGSQNISETRFPRWGMALWCRVLRGAVQRTLVFPLVRLTYSLRVAGTENLDGLNGPVLYASNHNLELDNVLIIKSFPGSVRRRLAIAAAAKLWRNPVRAVLNPILGNGFPFSQEGTVRASLVNLGQIVDNGWSVLIYPEGGLTVGGPIQPFMSGTGLLAVEGRLPLIPIRLHIHKMGFPSRLPLIRRGEIEVRFGKPLAFPSGTGYEEATAAIEDTIRNL